MTKIAYTLSLSLVLSSIYGQLPNTQLHLIEYANVDTSFNLKSVTYLSNFNPTGYNNQPNFFSLNELYISSDYYTPGKPEIIKLDLYKESLERMTMSAEADFSPAPLPDNSGFSTVRIEQDGTTQTLWAYDDETFDPGNRLMDSISNIGYYQWLNDYDIAMFLIYDKIALGLGNVSNNQTQIFLEGIGRCFKKDHQGILYFNHKVGETHFIKTYDPDTQEIQTICKTLEGSSDFELIGNNALLMGKGSTLYYYDQDISTEWLPIMDLSSYGIYNIDRMSASRGRLVVVSSPNQ